MANGKFGGLFFMNKEVDFVVTWVDGNDIEHIKLRNKYKLLEGIQINEESNNICRFKDNGELKYLFRSIEQNAKFIRYIFFVTNGQIPKWLNVKHPKIKIITHEQIMPKDALPTFNSNAIEACIANISGLSDRFLYANDDCFIAKPISKEFFFNKKGYPIVRLKPMFNTEHLDDLNLYGRQMVFTLNLFNKKFNKKFYLTEHHNIDAFYKPDIINCLKEFKDDFDKTVQCKFRKDKTVSKFIWSLYSFYIGHSTIKGYFLLNGIILFMNLLKKIKSFIFHKTKIHKIAQKKNLIEEKKLISFMKNINDLIYRKILKSTMIMISNTKKYDIKNVNLFCMNDTDLATDEDRIKSINFLGKIFPKKSSFEI